MRKLIIIIILVMSVVMANAQGNFFMWNNSDNAIWKQVGPIDQKKWTAIDISSSGISQATGINILPDGELLYGELMYSNDFGNSWAYDNTSFGILDIASSYNLMIMYSSVNRNLYHNYQLQKRTFNQYTFEYTWNLIYSTQARINSIDCSLTGDIVSYTVDNDNRYNPTVHAYTSIDGGSNFYAHTFNDLAGEHPVSTAVSGDGERILVCFDNGYVKVGVHNISVLYNWLGYYIAEYIKKGAISNDGSRISLAISNAKYMIMINSGEVRVRTISDINLDFRAIAISGNGQYQVLVSYEGYVFTSNDFGETWKEQYYPGTNLVDVAISDDGKKITCIGNPGYIYTLNSN